MNSHTMMAGPRRLRLMVGRARLLGIIAVFSPFHPEHTGWNQGLSCVLPGKSCRIKADATGPASRMGKNVLIWPAGKIKSCPGWQEVKTRLGKLRPVFATQNLVQSDLELVQVDDIKCRILFLGI